MIRLYCASGGDHGDGHVLIVTEEDMAFFQACYDKARAIFAVNGAPDSVTWTAGIDVIKMSALSSVDEDLADATNDDDGATADESAVAGIELTRVECAIVTVSRYGGRGVSVEWYAKHDEYSAYFVVVALGT